MKGKRTLALAAVIILALAAAGAWLLSRKQPAARSVSGTVEVDEARVASRYGGRVEKILVSEGNALKAGEVIVELGAEELKARRDFMAATLEELENGARPEEIAAVKHQWESQLADLNLARTDAARAKTLFEEKTISEADRDRAVSRARVLEQTAEAAKQRYELLVAGTRPEKIAQAKAQLAEVGAQLHEMRIVAPAQCVLEVLSVRVGDVLRPNQEVATLLLTEQLWLRVYVPLTWLERIELGQEVKVRIAPGSGSEVVGTIDQINRRAEFTPRNVQTAEDRSRQVFGVKVRLPCDSPLRAGMSVDVFFPDAPEKPK